MHHFVFKYRYTGSNTTIGLAVNTIKKLAPDAKICSHYTNESCYVLELLRTIDPTTTYTVIDVEDAEQAERLMEVKNLLQDNGTWWTPDLKYVFRDINLDKLNKDAIMLKLAGTSKYEEDLSTETKAYNLSAFNRKLANFMHEVNSYSGSIEKELVDQWNKVYVEFTDGLDEFRKERKRAKYEANKAKNSLRAKLIKYAIYKG